MGGRGVVVLGVLALILVFVIPPVGLGLGVVTLFFASRLMRDTKPEWQELRTPEGTPITVKVPRPGRTNAVFGLVLGITATALGALVLLLLLTFWNEISDYSKCTENTTTTQGSQLCKDTLEDSLRGKFGL